MDSTGIWTFSGCRALSEVQFPEGMTTLSNHCLYNCKSLESVEIPDTVTKVDQYALGGTDKLTAVNLPAGVTELGDYAVGFGEGALPDVNPAVTVVSDSPAVQQFLKDNGIGESTEQPTEPQPGKAGDGDANEDGAVDILDIVALQKYLLGSGELKNSNNADMNGDDVLDAFDLALLKRKIIDTEKNTPDAEIPAQPTDPVAAE